MTKKKKLKNKNLTKKILTVLGIPSIFIPGLILAAVLGWEWKTDLARLANRGGYYQSESLFPKKAIIAKVIDGDTLELKNGRLVRLTGVDAPERGEDFYDEAVNFSVVNLMGSKEIELEYDNYQDDKFGRILAYVWFKNKQKEKAMLNLELVKKGLAKVLIYEARAKLKYQDELIKAEQKAVKQGKGIWEIREIID